MEKESVLGVKLEEVNSINQRIVVEVPEDRIRKSAQKAMASLKKEAKIPGFRQGMVPDEMIKRKLGKGYQDEVLQQLVRDTYPEAINLVSAIPIAEPRIEADAALLDETKPFTYKAVFEIYPKVEPKDYEGLKLEKEKVEVLEDEVTRELEGLRQRMTQLEPAVDAVIGKGILARIDFKGTADGKPFKGSEAQDFVIDIEAGNVLEVFEKNLVGLKQGDERAIEFEYPADYFNKEIAGKKGTFTVKVKELRRKVVPALDDSFAKDLGLQTLDEVKKALNERIGAMKEHYQRTHLHRQVQEALAKNQPIDIPDVMVSRELGHMLEELSHELEERGKTLEEAGITADKFVKANLEEALVRVRAHVILGAIAEKEKIEVSPEETEERLKAIAASSNEQLEKVRAKFESQNLIKGLMMQLRMEKTLDLLISKAKVKEIKPKTK